MTHGNTRHPLRYLVRCEHTLRLICWSNDFARAASCARGLRARFINCFIETAKQ